MKQPHNIREFIVRYGAGGITNYIVTFLDDSEIEVIPRQSYYLHGRPAGKMRNAFKKAFNEHDANCLLQGLRVSNGNSGSNVMVTNPEPCGLYMVRTWDERQEIVLKAPDQEQALVMAKQLMRTEAVKVQYDHTQLNGMFIEHMKEHDVCYLDSSSSGFKRLGGVYEILMLPCVRYRSREEKIEAVLAG